MCFLLGDVTSVHGSFRHVFAQCDCRVRLFATTDVILRKFQIKQECFVDVVDVMMQLDAIKCT